MRGFGSIKRTVTVLMVSITLLLVTLASVVLSYVQYTQVRATLEERTLNFAKLAGALAVEPLVFDQAPSLERMLDELSHAPFVQHVHIYRNNSTNQLIFFASYNAPTLAPIPSRAEQVQLMQGVTLQPRYFDTALPIALDDRLLGYVYLRTDREVLDHFVGRAVVTSLGVVMGALLLAYLLSLKLRGYITEPLDLVVHSMNRVASEKNYDLRLAHGDLEELNNLTNAFDIMLGRIQQHITRQHIAEQQASELNAELERQVLQRTQALKSANDQFFKTLETLHQYQQELVEAKKMSALGDMVAGVAHEVNTPVGLVITSTSILHDQLQLLEQKFRDKTMTSQDFQRFLQSCQENLEVIERNINRTADLISRFQQLAMDQFADDPRPFELGSFCDDVVAALYNRLPELQRDHLHLTCPRPLWLEAQPGPINQVILQLVQNSLQHGFYQRPQGDISIAISYSAEQQQLLIDYRDNGSGIDEALQKRIFDPFITTKRGSGATGLGLHLVYNLVCTAMKGAIEVHSDGHSGTQFLLQLPAKQIVRSEHI